MNCDMKVNLDLFEMSWLLESCLRGSHLRSGTVDRFVDTWYGMFNGRERESLYEWMLRIVYEGTFNPMPSMCGADERLMARYDPNNQYEVEALWSDTKRLLRAFKLNDKYYINSTRYVNPSSIINVRKLTQNEANAERRFISISKKERP